MALNSSGPISLAGPTVGQSIAVELGLSPTGQIDLNQSNVRALAGITTGMISLNDFYGKSSISYWLAWYTGPTYTGTPATSVQAFTSGGNMYFSAALNPATSRVVFRISDTGSLIAACQIDFSASSVGIADDGTIILAGSKQNGTYNRCCIVKLSADLSTFLGVYGFNQGSGSPAANSQSIAVAKYAIGRSTNNNMLFYGGRPRGYVFDKNLNFITTFRPYNVQADAGSNGGVDASENMYGLDRNSSNISFIGKWNSAGVVQWATSLPIQCRELSVGSSGFIALQGENNATAAPTVIAMNTDGTYRWGRVITTQNFGFGRTAVDSSDNVYCVCNGPAPSILYVYKFDVNGNLIWQRQFSGSVNPSASGIAIAPDGSMVLSGAINGAPYVFKLPADGSRTGTYTVNGISLTYSASSETISNVTYTATPVTAGSDSTRSLFTHSITRTNASATANIVNV
jgi:hypothetical protein